MNINEIKIESMNEDKSKNKFNITKFIDLNQDGIASGNEIFNTSILYHPYYVGGTVNKKHLNVFRYDISLKR